MRHYAVKVNGKEFPVNVIARRGEVIEFEINGKSYSTTVTPIFNVSSATALPNSAAQALSSNGDIKAPMPGIIVSIAKTVGATVAMGDNLLVIEAMKMENNITAPKAGKIKKIHIKAGQEVENGQLLISIE